MLPPHHQPNSHPPPPPFDADPDLEFLERSILTLQELGKKQPLYGEEKRQSEETSRTIREHGFTAEQSSVLSNGGFAKSTIKDKAAGAKTKDRSAMNKAVELMSQMVALGLTFQDVKDAIRIRLTLDQNNAEIGDVAMLIGQAKNSGIELQAIISDNLQMKQEGITLQQLREVLSYKQELDSLGITTTISGNDDSGLRQIALAAKSHGDVNKIIEAINKYGGLPALEKQVGELQSTIDANQEMIESLNSEISDLQDRRDELEVPLERLDKIRALGFDEQSFDQIYKIAISDGKTKKSVKEVVDGLARYSTFLDLESDISDLYKKISNSQLALKQLQSEHAHMQAVLDMSDSLLHKHKFSISAIRDLVKVARDYGRPMEVLEALAGYGSIQALQNEISRLEKSKADLEIKFVELDRRTGEISSKADAIVEFIMTSINPLNEEFKRAAADLERTYHSQITLLKTEAAEYGKRLGEAKYLEESLKLARLVHLMIKVPSDATVFPIDYAVLMLDGVIRFCIAKNVNPTVNIVKTFSLLGINNLDAVPVVNVIDVTKRVLQQYTNIA